MAAADTPAERGGEGEAAPWELREWIDLPGGGRLERIGHLIGAGLTLQSYRVDFTLPQLGGLLAALSATPTTSGAPGEAGGGGLFSFSAAEPDLATIVATDVCNKLRGIGLAEGVLDSVHGAVQEVVICLDARAIAAPAGAGVVEEPTPAMWSAGRRAVNGPCEMIRTASSYEAASAHADRLPDAVWKAMEAARLAAAPAPAAAGGTGSTASEIAREQDAYRKGYEAAKALYGDASPGAGTGGADPVLAARAEYGRWATGSDTRRSLDQRHQVFRQDGDAFDEISAHPSGSDAENARDDAARDAAIGAALAALRPAGPAAPADGASFQARNAAWMAKVMRDDPTDTAERVHRHTEEDLELTRSLGQTRAEAHALVDYVHDQDHIGDPAQEVGGTLTTLALLCSHVGIDMAAAGEAELARCSTPAIVAKIREKRSKRHGRGPLPGTWTPDFVPTTPADGAAGEVVRDLRKVMFGDIRPKTTEERRLYAIRNVDGLDCQWLMDMLPNSGHGKFWWCVAQELRDEIRADANARIAAEDRAAARAAEREEGQSHD